MDQSRPCPVNCELFGRHAQYFESKIVPLWQEVYDSLVSRARIGAATTVLDAGTGTGEIALRVGSLVGPDGRVVAVDAMEEMLKIARSKAAGRKLGNVEFRQTSLERMDLPTASFDSVVGNYSLCCCLDYSASLSEILRVLKPRGRLTYNHGGPLDALASQEVFKVFEEHKTKTPSRRLLEIRESDAIQTEAVKRYRDPLVTLELMRNLGYSEAEATTVRRLIRYKDAADFVDRMLAFDWRSEAEEMSEADLARFMKEAVEVLVPLGKGPGFGVEDDMVFFTGVKK